MARRIKTLANGIVFFVTRHHTHSQRQIKAISELTLAHSHTHVARLGIKSKTEQE